MALVSHMTGSVTLSCNVIATVIWYEHVKSVSGSLVFILVQFARESG